MTTTPNTPDTVQELLDRQEIKEDEINFQELACKALIKCSAEENFQVASVILESLRDWHVERSRDEDASPQWLVDAARLDVALKTINLVSWD